MKQWKLLPMLLALVIVLAMIVPVSAIEKGTTTVVGDSTVSRTGVPWYIGELTGGEDTDIDTSIWYDVSSYSSLWLQAKFRGNPATAAAKTSANYDSNLVTIRFEGSSKLSPGLYDGAFLLDSLCVGAAATTDTGWYGKQVPLRGCRYLRYVVYPTAAAKIDSCGVIGYLEQFWTRGVVGTSGR